MPSIGKIKTLIAKWKIRDAIFAHGKSQPLPIVKRGVFNFDLGQLAVRVRDQDLSYFAAMPLGQRDGERV